MIATRLRKWRFIVLLAIIAAVSANPALGATDDINQPDGLFGKLLGELTACLLSPR